MSLSPNGLQPQDTRFAIYATGGLLALVAILHTIFGIVTGHNDQSLEQLQDALVPLFIGSIVLDRATIHKVAERFNGKHAAVQPADTRETTLVDSNKHNG